VVQKSQSEHSCVVSKSRRERKRFVIFTQPSSTYFIYLTVFCPDDTTDGIQNQKSPYFNSRQKVNKHSQFLGTVSGNHG
jgi:hypothetical protein